MKLNINYRVATSKPQESVYFDDPQDAEKYYNELIGKLDRINCFAISKDRWPILDRQITGYNKVHSDLIYITLQTLSDGMLL